MHELGIVFHVIRAVEEDIAARGTAPRTTPQIGDAIAERVQA